MIEPRLNYVTCPGAAAQRTPTHRMAYWEWGEPQHPHVIVCVHGLTRQGRDFDVLARALCRHARVVCPDVAGRGYSDWLADPMHYGVPQYAADMQCLLQQLHAQSTITQLSWVGTSMGGLIGMALAGAEQPTLPVAMQRLLLNDVGPELQWPALQRIACYVGQGLRFDTVQQAADVLRQQLAGFGWHSPKQWLALTEPCLRPCAQGGWQLHYDPAIALPFQSMTQVDAAQGAVLAWAAYDRIQAQTLLLRGAQSDLLSQATQQAMQVRGPAAQYIELEDVGHAPTLVASDQVAIARKFLVGEE